MLTVIIPTVQKRLKILKKSLSSLQLDEAITEIIVINNKVEEPLDLSEFSKVRIYTPKENLYVNPSWNLGVELACNNIFCLMNDDVLFHQNFCSDIVKSSVFNSLDTGLVGISNSSICNLNDADDFDYPERPSEDWIAKFLPMGDTYLGTGDWGIAIFGKKENYFTIPDKYKIIYGDNWLLYRNYEEGRQNYGVVDMKCHHVHSASCASPEFEQVVCSDISNANNSEEFGGKG